MPKEIYLLASIIIAGFTISVCFIVSKLEGLKNRKVTKYLDFFVVDGRRPYVVEEELCTCDDYIFRGSRTGDPCWHLIAVKIARITGRYEKVEEWFHEIGL